MHADTDGPRAAGVPVVAQRPAAVSRWLRVGLLAGLLLLATELARADESAGAAFVAEVWGPVWVLDRGAGWVAAQPGQPFGVGDRLATGHGGRAVVYSVPATLRLDGGSEVERIAPGHAFRVQLLAGRLALQVAAGAGQDAQVLTAHGRMLPLAVGHYRVDRVVDATVVETLSGLADFESGRELRSVRAGQRLAFWRDHAGNLRADVVTMTADDFGRWLLAVPHGAPRHWAGTRPSWARERERFELERHPRGVPHPWPGKPRVLPKDGHWVWMAPWGWVWVPEQHRHWRPHPGERPPHRDRHPHDRHGDDRHRDDRWRHTPGARDPHGHVPTPRPPPR